MRMCHFWAQNGPLPPAPPKKNFFLVQTIIITFTHLLALFNVQNFKKILQRIQSYDTPFLGPKWSLPPSSFFWKIIDIILIYLLALSFCKISKTFFQQIQSYDAQFLGPKWPISPNENFFKEPITEPCFFHSCQSTCQKSKSDINLLVKY